MRIFIKTLTSYLLLLILLIVSTHFGAEMSLQIYSLLSLFDVLRTTALVFFFDPNDKLISTLEWYLLFAYSILFLSQNYIFFGCGN